MEFVRVSVSYMRKTASQIDSTIQNLLLHVVLTGQMCQRFGFQIRSSFDGMYTMSLFAKHAVQRFVVRATGENCIR